MDASDCRYYVEGGRCGKSRVGTATVERLVIPLCEEHLRPEFHDGRWRETLTRDAEDEGVR